MGVRSDKRTVRISALCLFLFLFFYLPLFCPAQEAGFNSNIHIEGAHPSPDEESDPAVGLEERIGAAIPLELAFRDEEGRSVTLGELVSGPTIIAPVYYGCPNVCNFLQAGLARVLPSIKRTPGEEFTVLSISFDENEGPELAAAAKNMYLQSMDGEFPAVAWRFLTGDIGAIRALTEAAGYRFRKTEDGQFLHPVVIFVVDSGGTIVRYLHGTHFLPKDITLALVEASEGRLGTTIQKVVRFCFSYEAENKTYVFNVLRVTGTVVLLTATAFLTFLLFGGKKRKKGTDHG